VEIPEIIKFRSFLKSLIDKNFRVESDSEPANSLSTTTRAEERRLRQVTGEAARNDCARPGFRLTPQPSWAGAEDKEKPGRVVSPGLVVGKGFVVCFGVED
jgi:hypothetical protein